MAMIENVTPILRVADLGARRRYYRQTLGFSLDWDADPMISVLATANRSCCAKANRASQASGSESASRTLMCCSPNFRQTARTSESPRRISTGPTSSRSKILTVTFFASGPSRSPGRPIESSRADLPCASLVRRRRGRSVAEALVRPHIFGIVHIDPATAHDALHEVAPLVLRFFGGWARPARHDA